MADSTVVLFDFDGTLADTIPLIVESYRAILPTAASEAEIRSWIGRPLIDVLEERYPGHGLELTERYREWNLAHHDELILPVPGIERVLDALGEAGHAIGVVSSKMGSTVQRGLEAVGLADRVGPVIGQEATATHKPDPAPLQYAAGLMQVPAGIATYVGDAWVDVAAARAAGMRSVAVTWGAGTPEQLADADALVDDAAGLRQVLLGEPASAPARLGGTGE